MTLQGPLSVHVAGMGTEHHVDAADLEFTRSAPGGFTSATFTLPAWVDSSDLALGPASRVMVDDGRTAKRLFEGFLDIPGKTVDDTGHTWQIGAIGSQSVLGDRSKGYISIDSAFDGWEYRGGSNANMAAAAGSLPTNDDIDALVLQWPNGVPVGVGSFVSMRYSRLVDTNQQLGYYLITHQEGVASVNNRLQVLASTLNVAGSHETAGDDPWTMSPDDLAASAGGSTFAPGHNVVTLQMYRSTGAATNINTDDNWSAVTGCAVIALRRDQTGAYVSGTGSYRRYLLAHEAAVDALWWLTNQIDIPNALIDTTFTYQVMQLAYPDGVRCSDLFADLAQLEPDLLWEVLESSRAGLHRFRLRRWPTDVRYEADTSDGYTSPGGEVDLANSLRVYWTDQTGAATSTDYSTDVPALDQWGRIRDAEAVQLGAEIGTQAAADQVGAAILAQIDLIPYAGTLTVARPIRDLYTGRMVQPWEIEPGYLVNVRDIDAPAMRLTEMTYRDSDLSASLTLGTPTYSTDEMVAKLATRRHRHGAVTPNAIGHQK